MTLVQPLSANGDAVQDILGAPNAWTVVLRGGEFHCCLGQGTVAGRMRV
jgi:hypothetical protein